MGIYRDTGKTTALVLKRLLPGFRNERIDLKARTDRQFRKKFTLMVLQSLQKERHRKPRLALDSSVPPISVSADSHDVSREYYHLFVIGSEIRNHRFSMPKDRVLTGKSTVIERLSALDDAAIAEIKNCLR
jgi:hypothetical protein